MHYHKIASITRTLAISFLITHFSVDVMCVDSQEVTVTTNLILFDFIHIFYLKNFARTLEYQIHTNTTVNNAHRLKTIVPKTKQNCN